MCTSMCSALPTSSARATGRRAVSLRAGRAQPLPQRVSAPGPCHVPCTHVSLCCRTAGGRLRAGWRECAAEHGSGQGDTVVPIASCRLNGKEHSVFTGVAIVHCCTTGTAPPASSPGPGPPRAEPVTLQTCALPPASASRGCTEASEHLTELGSPAQCDPRRCFPPDLPSGRQRGLAHAGQPEITAGQ